MLTRTQALSLAAQSNKGTAATTNYIRGRMEEADLYTEFEEDDPSGEMTGVNERATAFQSNPITIGHIVRVMGEQRLYPHMFGYALMGFGFKVSTTPNSPVTGAYTHVFTLADADELKWISAILQRGEDSGRAGQRAKDVRLSQGRLNSSRQGIRWSFEGVGISEGPAAGTETHAAEPNAPLSPATGGLTLTSSDLTANTIGTPQGYEMNFDNPLDTEDQNQHSAGRADFDPQGFGLSGAMLGLVFSHNAYGELTYGSAGGSSASVTIPEAQLQWNWTSVANITGSTKYSAAFNIAVAQVRLREMARGRDGKVRYAARWRMLDRSASAPITVTLTNGYASYAGS